MRRDGDHGVGRGAGLLVAERLRSGRVVLRPGGRLALADFRATDQYAARLREHGLILERRGLGWRFWYGGPWAGTTLLTATEPA